MSIIEKFFQPFVTVFPNRMSARLIKAALLRLGMVKRKNSARQHRKALLQALREMRMMMHDMNHKLDHLIKSYRKFYITDDFSHSHPSEFHG